MQSFKVALVDIGEYLPLSLKSFCKKVNSIQSSFYFEEAGTITSQVLGNPDIEDDWYDVNKIFSILKEKLDSIDFNFIIGITKSKITNKNEINGKAEKDYFSQSDFHRYTVISVNKRVLQFNSPNKNIIMYLAHLIFGEILMNYTQKDLNHLGQEPCLFNECEDRMMFRECIERSIICPSCIAKLKTNNVSDFIIKDIKKILSWCRLNSWKFAFSNIYKNPISSLGFGIGFGWYISTFFSKGYYPLVLIITFIPAIIVFILSRLSKLN